MTLTNASPPSNALVIYPLSVLDYFSDSPFSVQDLVFSYSYSPIFTLGHGFIEGALQAALYYVPLLPSLAGAVFVYILLTTLLSTSTMAVPRASVVIQSNSRSVVLSQHTPLSFGSDRARIRCELLACFYEYLTCILRALIDVYVTDRRNEANVDVKSLS